MFTCDMNGCDDIATYEVGLLGETLDVCQICAEYWANGAHGRTQVLYVTKCPGVLA